MKNYAIALYDNEAESEDELNFKKNDLFQLLQIDYEGMEGWWLCKSLKTKLVGLAAGNRLKLVTDENILLKLNNLDNKLSASSSQSSLISSNSTSSSVKSIEIDLKQLEILSSPNKIATTNNKTKFILPAKKKTNTILKTINDKKNSQTPSIEEDDYDYDIPENNKPTTINEQTNASSINEEQLETRKSTSPTIDSGISTCSLVSCNSDISIKHLSSSSSKSTTDDETANQLSLKIKFQDNSNKIIQLIKQSKSSKEDMDHTKDCLIELKSFLYDFLADIMKRCKKEHACFHFDLNVFNKFKTYYRQLKEFYLYFVNCMNTLTNVYDWNLDIIRKESNEFNELLTKLNYLNDIIESLKQLIDKNSFFDYHSQTTSDFNPNKTNNSNNNNNNDDYEYEYEYDNNDKSPEAIAKTIECQDDYENIYESNYCQINENEILTGNTIEPEPLIKILVEQQQQQQLQKQQTHYDPMTSCMTLKKNEEKIKREIRIATSTTTESSRINLADQMLLKFYLKHIEDNLNELNLTYDKLIVQIQNNLHLDSLAHKLAIYGHKLVFICDTLERNINNINLKTNLNESSNCLSDSLKIYMIRVKSIETNNNNSTKQSDFLIESLNNVLNASNHFKQCIIKYYFKSF